MQSKKKNSSKLIILFTDDIYKFFYGLNLANTIKACNESVEVFFSGYTCNFLKKNLKKIDEKNLYKTVVKSYNCNLDELFELSKSLQINLFLCETALQMFKIKKTDLRGDLNIKSIGLYTLVAKYKSKNIIFI